MPELLGERVFHYSIPVLQETGNGQEEDSASIQSAKIVLKGGEVLVSRLNPRKGLVLRAQTHDVPTVASSEFVPLVPRSAEADFVRYAFQAHYVRAYLSSRAQSATRSHQRCAVEVITRAPILWPPLERQRVIVRFLDAETAKIDALIARKTTLSGYVEEEERSTVLDLLSRGVGDADAKATSLDWLPGAPSHWEVAPLYARYEVKLGKMLDAKRITGAHLAPYLRNVNVQWDHMTIEDLPEMDFSQDERRRLELRVGDLLVCEGGEVGRTAMWRGELEQCYFQKAVHRLRPLSDKDVPRYFFYVMFAAAKSGHFRAGGNPNTIDHLTGDQLRHYRFPFPPRDEQEQIAALLDAERERLAQVRQGINEARGKLIEYRSALITAAVTGQIDVGSAA